MKPRDLFFVFACVSVISMILIDHAGIFSYWGRSALKIMMFGIIPAMIISKTHTWTTIFSKGRYLKHVLLLGVLIFLVVLAGYWLLDGIIAFDQVPDALVLNLLALYQGYITKTLFYLDVLLFHLKQQKRIDLGFLFV